MFAIYGEELLEVVVFDSVGGLGGGLVKLGDSVLDEHLAFAVFWGFGSALGVFAFHLIYESNYYNFCKIFFLIKLL